MGNQVASTKKTTDSSSCDYAFWASSCMQGWRPEMEDVHLSIARLFDPCDAPPPFQLAQDKRRAGGPRPLTATKRAGTAEGSLFCASPISFFGVFDGHGGAVVPAFVGATLPSELARELCKQNRSKFIEEKRQEASLNAKTRIFLRQKKVSAAAAAAVRDDVAIPQFVSRALRNAFVETDWKAIDEIPNEAAQSGTTTIVALVVAADRPKVVTSKQNFAADGTMYPPEVPESSVPPLDPAVARQQPIFGNSKRGAWGLLWVANSGDSRGVLCRKGVAVPMSEDHKPWKDDELARIEAAGHNVTNNRVDGGINLSRGIGDWRYKTKASKPEQWAVTCVPDVRRRTLAEDDEFLVLGCDGIWDRMTSQEMCNFIRLRLMPRSHWTEDELAVNQGVNSKFYDPYTEYERVVRERTRSRKQAKKEAEAKKKKLSEEAVDDGEDVIQGTAEAPERDLYEDDLDEMTRHHKEILEKVCEPKEEFERYKLWPGDPGVCTSVEDLLTTIAKHVCNNCLSADGDSTAYGTDNMTVTIILFRNSTLGRAVYKRYPHKHEGSSTKGSASTRSRRSMSSAGTESDSGVLSLSDSDPAEFRGSSSGSPGTAGVVPQKVAKNKTTSPDSASSTPTIESSKKHSKHKKHSKRHHEKEKVDLTSPMSDAEKMVYQFADEFSDDDRYVVAPTPPEK